MLTLLFMRNGIHNSSIAPRIYLWWNIKLCKIFKAHINIHGLRNNDNKATLYVMNHISWFDIPVLASQQPLHFLSKAEVRSWPFIGWFANRAGTLFIQRGVSGAASKSLSEITHCLQHGGSVALFPEGTTTDGSSIRKFHGRLLQAAIDAKIEIQPVALRYPYKNGINPYVPYVGEMSFMDSLFGLTQSKPLNIELHFLPPIVQHLEHPDAVSRKQLALLAHNAIAEKLDLGLFKKE
ncbi:Acyl-CoA:1-acyl-sn-glycerol-3-phosphate acyltransferase [hydrothermal vent metagenome]|uniref:Acyl-CoA:1-acyl-sn-glycerol-3-phosphate acyltransferase n=1 Tax=hydrothermal vent metagenome TaxID=652676 RepID=A0A3B0YB97_9ZZZZ